MSAYMLRVVLAVEVAADGPTEAVEIFLATFQARSPGVEILGAEVTGRVPYTFCSGCGHLDHQGVRCNEAGTDDMNEECVCSYPDPGNYRTTRDVSPV